MSEQLTFEFKERPTIKGFPELRWTGKRPYRSTQYYPAQLRERYGEERDGWINRIYWGDNLQVMSHLLKEFRGQVDLIYIDPPFDSKADYKKKITLRGQTVTSDSSSFEEKQYGDIWTNDEYLQFMYERLILMRELLSDKGSIYVHLDEKRSHYIRLILDEVFGQDAFRREIIWDITVLSGFKVQAKNWIRGHDTVLYYSKSSTPTFHKLRQPHQQKYIDMFNRVDENGERYLVAHGMTRYLKDVIDKGKPYGDVWDDITSYHIFRKMVEEVRTMPELQDLLNETKEIQNYSDVWDNVMSFQQQPTAAENVGYPTQKPQTLLERIINASTNPGDLVFDCFMGSGTTQAVAMKLGRRFIGADINLGAIQTTTKRLITLAAELDVEQETKPQSTLLTGGKDYQKVERVAEDSKNYLVAASAEDDENRVNEVETDDSTEVLPYTGFEVYNVNNYEFFRNPVEARDLLIEALEIQPFPQSDIWDGELDGRMVKIMPVNRIATKADLEELKANLPYKTYEKRKEESPRQPVEKITLICMGHEPDLKASLEAELSEYKLDIEIVDILRDKADLQLKRDSEADIAIEGGRLVIRAFYPLNLMQKLSLQKEFVEDWRQLVESVMIDWNYDGAVMQPSVMDVPGKKEMVKGIYDIPEGAGTIKVKITDLLSESLEVEVR
jgi:DNA modification methylase